MKLKFNKIKNNCYYIEIYNICICISYESIIGFYDKEINFLFISEFYKNRSKTTKRHINYFQKEFNSYIKYIDNDLLEKIFSEISEKSISTILNKVYLSKNFNFD